jgi:hypothetical protein
MPRTQNIIFSARSAHRGPFAPGTTGGANSTTATPPTSLNAALKRCGDDRYIVIDELEIPTT